MPGPVDPVRELSALASGKRPIDSGRVAQEFEALLLAELMKTASTPLGVSGILDGGSAGRLYREMFLEQVARMSAARGGFGLGSALAEELQSATTGAEERRDAEETGR
jgi:Rod binding domain-containing protein